MGWGCRLELAWGRWRRWYLKRFRPAYVVRMARLRIRDATGAPHEILDPRDLKYCRNICDCRWRPEDDPFQWRERLPFASWGLAELIASASVLAFLAVLAMLSPWPWIATIPAVALAWVAYFFRDPPRTVPAGDGLFVSPADGKVSDVAHLPHDDFLEGPAVRIGIFLSIFNVHVNRMPTEARVIGMDYRRGEFLNALKPESAIRNESMWIGCEEEIAPHRRFVVRQIVGAIARRIVCDLCPGESVLRGHKFGMIKFGSRTELIVPDVDGLTISVKAGDRVRAGVDVLCRFREGKEQ